MPPEGILSPTGTGKTPYPVMAGWFNNCPASTAQPQSTLSNLNQTTQLENSSGETNTMKKKIIVKAIISASAESIDDTSVKSDTTVIENKEKSKSPDKKN